MKIIALTVATLCLGVSHLCAQVSAEIVFDQEQFLIGETLTASVKITNRSGQTLRFGSDVDWLTFTVESRNGFIVNKKGEVPVQGEFVLESGKVATRRVDLAPWYELNRTGRYAVSATLRVKEWDSTVNVPPKSFDIINAAKLWTQEFGVPLATGITNRPPEVRRYTLEQANYLRGQLRLYLRLTDAQESHVIKLFPIGPMVSFSGPEHQIDRESNLHVFYQNGARSFMYMVINPDGEIILRQSHDQTETRPRLRVEANGKIGVVGGARRYMSSDLPGPDKTETNVPKVSL